MKTLPILTLALAAFSILPVRPAHGAAMADTEAEQAVLRFEQAWANAYVKGDAETLERIMAEEFIFTGPDGVLQTKADDVRNLKSGALKMTECKLEDLKVRIYGNTAIVTGVNILKGSLDGQDLSGRYRFTDVLVRKKDKWQAVSAHASAITDKK